MSATALPSPQCPAPILRTRAPQPMADAVHRAAAASGQTPSACLRDLIAAGLRERGLWPPVCTEAPDACP